jgi:hypothetical protein
MLTNTAKTKVMLIVSTTLRVVEDVKTYGTFEIFTYRKFKTVLLITSVSREL